MLTSNKVRLAMRPTVVVNVPDRLLARVYRPNGHDWQREYWDDALRSAVAWLGAKHLLANHINRKEQ